MDRVSRLRQFPEPALAGDRVFVRLARPGDAADLLDFHTRNADYLKPWSPPAPSDFLTLGYWQRWTSQALPLFDQDRSVRMVILPRQDSPIGVGGQINFSNIVRGAFQAATVGYHIDRQLQGQGLMTEALRLAVRYGLSDLGLHRLMASHLPENHRSAKLLARLGFDEEGYARDYLFIDGAWRDHVLTAIVNRDAPPPLTPGRQPSGTPPRRRDTPGPQRARREGASASSFRRL